MFLGCLSHHCMQLFIYLFEQSSFSYTCLSKSISDWGNGPGNKEINNMLTSSFLSHLHYISTLHAIEKADVDIYLFIYVSISSALTGMVPQWNVKRLG